MFEQIAHIVSGLIAVVLLFGYLIKLFREHPEDAMTDMEYWLRKEAKKGL